jgi:hypothetical protein
MSGTKLSDRVRKFIFQSIDSVELLEVLLYLRQHFQEWKNADHVSRELRSNRDSILSRLEFLESLGLLEKKDQLYRYFPLTPEQDETVSRVAEDYKTKRHQILELIFSPSRQAKQFADAFLFNKKIEKKKEEDQ